MNAQEEILRLTESRDKIRAKSVQLGIANSTDKLDVIAQKIDTDLANRGAVSASVKEGETYTIEKGYHNGSGTVSGVSGGGQYNLQSKTTTPTKLQQNITPDGGFYGLSDVTVNPIPSSYQDVSGVTASAPEVLVTKTFVAPDGTLTAGTMPNNGTVNGSINGMTTTEYAIPAGYHSGEGKVVLTNDIVNALAAI